MPSALPSIDVSTLPDLAQLVDEVANTNTARELRRGGEVIALLVLIHVGRGRRKVKTLTQEQIAAAEAAFGSWKDHIDVDELKRQLNEAQIDDRPAASL